MNDSAIRKNAQEKFYLALLVIILCVTPIFLLNPSIRGNDGVLNYVYLRSLFFDGDIDFSNDYCEFDHIKHFPFNLSDTPFSPETGLQSNRYGVGSSLLWFPFFLFGHCICFLIAMINHGVRSDGFSRPYEYAIALGSVTYVSVALVVLYYWLRKYCDTQSSFWTIIFVLFSTPLLFYTYMHPSMSHANSFFLVTLFLYMYLEERPGREWVRWGALGCIAALLVMTRFQDVSFLGVIVVGEIMRVIKTGKNPLPKSVTPLRCFYYCIFVVLFVACFIPQLLAWKTLYGSYLSGPAPYLGYKEFNIFYPRHLIEVLFSSNHGLLFWHPWLIVGIIGLFVKNVHFLFRHRVLLLVVFLGSLYLVSCWQVWWAGASFGHRMFVASLPVIALGTGVIIHTFRGKIAKVVVPVMIIFIVLWNAGLIVQYAFILPREGTVKFETVMKNQFTEVPRLLFHKTFGYLVHRDGIENR